MNSIPLSVRSSFRWSVDTLARDAETRRQCLRAYGRERGKLESDAITRPNRDRAAEARATLAKIRDAARRNGITIRQIAAVA